MIAEMKKVRFVVPIEQRADFLTFLQEERRVQLADENEASNDHIHKSSDETEALLAQLQFVIDFIQEQKKHFNNTRKFSISSFFPKKPIANLVQLEDRLRATNIETLTKRVQTLNDAMTASRAKSLELTQQMQMLESWQKLSFGRADMDATPHVIHRLLSITLREESDLEKHLQTLSTGMWQEVHRIPQKNKVVIFGELVAHVSERALVETFEEELGAVATEIPESMHNSIPEYLSFLKAENKRELQHEKKLFQEGAQVASQEQDILFVYDALLNRVEREKATEYTISHNFSFSLSGWIPEIWFTEFTKTLEKHFPSATLEEIEIAPDEITPVMFHNNRYFRPFEVITDLYGKPAYHEPDPTGPLAIFFLVSFGLAVTDAGYGIILMLCTFLAERFIPLKENAQKMMRVLFYAGAMTIVLGAATGGWFSINLDTLPTGAIKDFLLGVKLLDPLKQPLVFLGFIFCLGMIQLTYAWVVRGIHHWKKGEKSIALMDDFSWVALIIIIILALAAPRIPLLAPYARILTIAMYVSGGFMIATQGRASKNIFLRVGGGILSLYGLVAFVSDTLSYSRLLALGLATGIIGFVVNLVASIVSSSVPVVGVVLGLAVLIVGHIFNLSINALGAYIHSGRLQFVEFFPKFLEGGGAPFRPFGRISKYVDNPKDYVKVL